MGLDALHFQLVEVSLAGSGQAGLAAIGPDYQKARLSEDVSRPTLPCGGPRMNPSVDVGNPPQSIRHLRMAERCTPDRIYESGPRSFSIGSKIGDHHHQLCRPACNSDARQNPRNSQEERRKKLALRLPATFVREPEGRTAHSTNIDRDRPSPARLRAGLELRLGAQTLPCSRRGGSVDLAGEAPSRLCVMASCFSPRPNNYLGPARSPPRRLAIAPESYAIPDADPAERSSANSGCANDCRTRACWFQSSCGF
jgi:hypothetical protein